MTLALDIRSYARGGRHRHPFTQALFPLEGSMKVDIEGARGIVTAGRIAVIPVDHFHDFKPSRDCRLMVLDVDPASDVTWLASDLPLFPAVETWIVRLLRSLANEVEADGRRSRTASTVVLAMLRDLVEHQQPRFRTDRRQRSVSRASEHMLSPGSRPSVSKAAAMAGLGRSQFHERYKAVYGTSPNQHRIQNRLEQAVGLLATTSIPVCEIAYAAGYENPSSFSRQFKNRFGISPTDYRDRSRDGQSA